MKKQMLIPALAFLMASCSGTDPKDEGSKDIPQNATEYGYEPEVSTLHGTLSTKLYWGPPGYGEDTTVDEREPAYILTLPQGINITTPKNDLSEGYNAAINNVLKIQVVPQRNIDAYVGKAVTVTGTLFGAQTGHHHTDVLLDLKTIR